MATTNLDDWGKDETGGRRFWPVLCEGEIDIPGMAELHDQLWAEAVALFHADEPWWLSDEAIIQTAQEEVENRTAGDPWEGQIQQAVADKRSVTVEHILDKVLNIEKARQGRAEQMRVVSILKRLHWRKDQSHEGGRAGHCLPCPPCITIVCPTYPTSPNRGGAEVLATL